MRLTRWLKTLGMAMLPLGAAHAAVYTCDSVACLGVAILAANSTVEPDSIELAPRRYVLASPATDDLPFGPTGFPVVTSTITIRGNNAILQRAFYGCSVSQPTQNPFRLFGISSRGRLILQDLTLTIPQCTAFVAEAAAQCGYCTSGMMSSMGYFVARYLGYRVRLYDGSMLEWTALRLPLEP